MNVKKQALPYRNGSSFRRVSTVSCPHSNFVFATAANAGSDACHEPPLCTGVVFRGFIFSMQTRRYTSDDRAHTLLACVRYIV